MSEDTSLSVRELLQQVCDKLGEELKGRQIALPHKATSEIANDSDWHRTRVGYMGYESVILVQIGEKCWVFGCGGAYGSYPADPYSSDIIVLSVSLDGKPDKELAQEICKAIERTEYFSDSVICGLADGCLCFNKGAPFGKKMMEVLQSGFNEYVARSLETDDTVFYMDLRPVVKSDMRYKPEFVDFLKDTIAGFLKEASK